MKKRIIALLIVCVLLVSLVPVMPTLAYGSSSVDLPRNNVVGETVTVTADGAGCQWQVKIGEVWVNISGATSPELALSYAMFANIPGAPVIRCVDASGNAASDEIVVNFVDAVEPVTKPAPAPEVITQPVVDAVITEPNGSAPVVQQPVVQEPAAQTPVDTAALQQALADAKAADEAAQAAAAAANAEADAKKAVLDAAQAEYDAAAAAVAAAQAALDASIVPVEEGQEPAPLDAELSAALSTAQLAATDAEAKLTAAQADYDAAALVAADAAAAAADTAAAVAAAQAALDAAAATPAVVEETTAPAAPKLKMASFNLAKNTGNEIATVDETTGDTLNTYNVVINYVFENNAPVADSYTAQLAAGSNFSANVTFPTVQGYLPYLDNVQQNSLNINIQNIQDSVTYTVVYMPTDVDYTVIHYQQNVDNDNYNEATRETLKGKTGSPVPDVAKKYSGFRALLYEKPTIAADGSTVVEIYYDRDYYLMNFELDGGYGTEPVYARYGAPIGTVNTPTKAGYTFTGWSDVKDGTTPVTVSPTMPAENTTYYAIWNMGNTAKVTVVFWGENADNEEYSYNGSGTFNATPNTEVTYTNQQLACATEAHTHSAECISCKSEEHSHSNSCYTNCTYSHTHGVGCYNAVGNAANNTISNYNGELVDGRIGYSGYDSYIYIAGRWYRYYNWDAYYYYQNGIAVQPDNCSNSHTHTNACLGCGKNEHSHGASCYSCGKPEHTHNDDCTISASELFPSALWTFVKSDEVTVLPDGSTVINVYYDRKSFTLTFKNYGTTVKTITRKWGADIHTEFPIKDGDKTMWWTVPSGTSSMKPGTEFGSLVTMPAENITFSYDSSTQAATLHYYVEALPGADGKTASQIYSGFTTNNYQGLDTSKKFTSYKDINVSTNGYLTYTEEFHNIVGFRQYISYPKFNKHEQGGTTDDIKNHNYLLYIRNAFDIEFYNPTELIKTQENVPYQMPLNTYNWTPTEDMIPEQYEPGSVMFEGWYLNPECSGKKFDFTTATMPAGPNNANGETALALYAKWVPVSHTVQFYLDKDAYDAGTELTTHPKITVPHGEFAGDVADPTNGAYVFVEWFYIDDEGKEAAFNFDSMPIRQDLKVYAKWSSNVLRPYTVYFKIQGTDTQIADPIESSGVAGHTKTFVAKANEELYAGYQEGYFPIVTSHSMTLNVEGDNTFTFLYVQKDAVPYTVYYVSEGIPEDTSLGTVEIDGKSYYVVAETKEVNDNRKAVVTEKFVPVNGMMPDAYQKRLIVDGTDGATNEIVFFYVRDTEHAYYQITHYTEDVSGTGWTEYASSQAVGDIGQTYTADPLTITGFIHDPSVKGTLTSGELTEDGLELKLYYKRNPYPYLVKYLENGTGKELADAETGTAKYGTVHSEKAIDIENYTVVGDAEKSITIKVEDGNEAKVNVIIFYYEENKVTINYEVVGPLGCGIVTPSSETVKVKSEDAKGSTAQANENFRFVGWYSDEACTEQNKLSENANFVPAKDKDGKNVAAIYYAKFEYDVTTLTITKSGAENRGYGLDGFIFKVEDSSGNVVATVAISGNGSTTIGGLKVGETYTVSEDSRWSGLYSCANQSVTLVPNGNTVTMENTFKPTNLLNGASSVTNRPGN